MSTAQSGGVEGKDIDIGRKRRGVLLTSKRAATSLDVSFNSDSMLQAWPRAGKSRASLSPRHESILR